MGARTARSAVAGSSMSGRRSVKNPRLISQGFLRAVRSIGPALNSWGKYQPAWAMTANRPMKKGLSVSLLTKKGRIVVAEMKLWASQNRAPSAKLTAKFQL